MVGRVANVSATSRACRARGIWRTTRQTDKREALYCSRHRPTNEISAWQAKLGSRPTRATHVRGCYDDTTRKLLQWNLGFTAVFMTAISRAVMCSSHRRREETRQFSWRRRRHWQCESRKRHISWNSTGPTPTRTRTPTPTLGMCLSCNFVNVYAVAYRRGCPCRCQCRRRGMPAYASLNVLSVVVHICR